MPDGPGGWGLHEQTGVGDGGSGFGAVLREFHVPWPACNQDAARQAGNAWSALADGIEDVLTECNNMVASITVNNAGAAIDAFGAKWQQYGGKAGSLTLTIGACRALAKACNDFADQVSEVKAEIEHKAEELAAVVAGAVVALIFTWGASIAVAEAAGDAVATWVTDLMATLADQAGEISGVLENAVNIVGVGASEVAGTAAEGAAAGTVRGTFAGLFTEVFETSLNAVNGEPQPSSGELSAGVAKDMVSTVLLGVIAEAVPTVAAQVEPTGTMLQAYNDALNINPQLAGVLMSSARITELLDTPAGKAFVAGGGITALHARSVLDDTESTAKSIEATLEAALNQMTSSGGE